MYRHFRDIDCTFLAQIRKNLYGCVMVAKNLKSRDKDRSNASESVRHRGNFLTVCVSYTAQTRVKRLKLSFKAGCMPKIQIKAVPMLKNHKIVRAHADVFPSIVNLHTARISAVCFVLWPLTAEQSPLIGIRVGRNLCNQTESFCPYRELNPHRATSN